MFQQKPRPGAASDDFAQFYAHHLPRLRRYCAFRFGAADADELAQDVMERALRSFASIASVPDPWPWLKVVARNTGLNRVRASSHATTIDRADLSHLPADASAGPEERLERDEERLLVRAALARLTSGQRQVLELRLQEGLEFHRIADLLGSNENAVRQQLFKARRAFAVAYGAVQRLPALIPWLAVGTCLRRLLGREPRQAARAGLAGATLTAVFAAVTLQLAAPSADSSAPRPMPLHRSVAAVTGAHTPVTAPARPVSRASREAVAGVAQVSAVPVLVRARVSRTPLAAGEHAVIQVSVATPAGTVTYRDETTSDHTGPVCRAQQDLCR